ncbi:HutD-family protein [Paramixta manurensis]|uniref:HutD-family protein n=1 Tax=Paramixta manurensis TaxID=2740817 RepID=A0A6M8UMF3_9GAMM|nr:HutD-family protein [Erwiniaceae bacterium PD-1]
MMHFYDTATLPVSRWRNGGGETREIVSFPPHAEPFGWRASIATIASSGDFSTFPEVDRVITLLEGDGVELHAAGRYVQPLQLNQPFRFAGEEAISAHLNGGESRDFNVMTRRGEFRSEVFTTAESQHSALGVCWIIAGVWRVGERQLTRGEGAWWEENSEPIIPVSHDALMLFAAISA